MLFDFFIKASLDLRILDDSFNDQIAVLQLRQIVFEVSHSDERSKIGSEEGRGFGFLGGFEPRASDLVPIARLITRNNVEQQRRDSGIGEMRGELCAHSSGAEHSSFFDGYHG